MRINKKNDKINLPEEVLSEAMKLRKFFEQNRKILEGVPEYITENLHCLCGYASFFLCYQLRKMKYKADLILGEYKGQTHCWVEINDHYLDITATQFIDLIKFPVYVTRKNNFAYKEHHKNRKALKMFENWGDQAYFLRYHNKKGNYLTYLIKKYNEFNNSIIRVVSFS